ncbi:hypothetical protein POM88_025561 [Heracleum sosnowskyi]|uniref:Uncharacterized protein n=1 Tax=Heracleum sosnowskyi TaxID=360622 RepID=A0AAD8I463_9APIA|nr:hypothetical protein POM88_025561 [Heracleum sosnowskyi]
MLKSSLGGRLIGFSSTTTNAALEQYCYYYPTPKKRARKIHSLSCSFTSSPSPRISRLTADDLISKPYKLEKEAKRGSDTDENEMLVKPVIRKGDVVCLSDLLFTKNRDYLVKNNNQQVKAEQLAGKGEDEAVAKQPSLKAVLASPQRDYVISNQGEKVPIHILEDKVVVLYFYREGETDDTLTEQLKTAYGRRKDGSEVPFSELAGKRVMFFYEKSDKNDRGNPNLETLRLMRSNGFETESFASVHIGDFPWLVSLGRNNPLPASFDGRLVRRTFYPTLEGTNFPFGDIEQETLKQLNELLTLRLGLLALLDD